MQFTVGVNYAPGTDAAARADVASIAAAGIEAVRFLVPWDDPGYSLEGLLRFIGRASDAGLQTLPSLTCRSGIGNIYTGSLLAHQIAFAREAGELLGAHPAIAAWDIGHAFTSKSPPASGKITSGEHASEPASERVVAEWSRRLAGAFKTSSPRALTAGTTSDDVTHDNNVRLATLCAPLTFASMQGSNISLPFARDRLDPEAVPFLALLAAAFSFKPVVVTGFGNPAEPYNTGPENAAYCTAVLERLHADGRLGAYWFNWPGAQSAVTAALGSFAREKREVRKPSDMSMISSTYYYRTLPDSTRTLYDAFLSFVRERRDTR